LLLDGRLNIKFQFIVLILIVKLIVIIITITLMIVVTMRSRRSVWQSQLWARQWTFAFNCIIWPFAFTLSLTWRLLIKFLVVV